jgi:hypothetical protein
MELYLYGSRAIKYWYPDFREPNDWDFIVSERRYKKSDIYKVEYKHIPPVIEYIKLSRDSDINVLPPNVLYTIKCSHLFWDIKWDKNFADARFLQKKGCKIIEPLFYELYEYWKKVHGNNQRSDLTLDKKEFFNNKLNRELKIDHDYLHTLLNPTPIYTKILKDGAEVEVDVEKFDNLSYQYKCKLVEEEVMVMAWERGRKTGNYFTSYTKMFKKFFMHHAPIWEAKFIIENWETLCVPKFNYFKTIEDGIQTSIGTFT